MDQTRSFGLRIALLFYVSLAVFSCQSQRVLPPTAKEGNLNLSEWDFQKKGIVPLDGEWEFYWQQEIVASPTSEPLPSPDAYATVPSVWKGMEVKENKELGGFGFASYKLNLFLAESPPSLSFHTLDLSSAYRLYVNGSLIHEEGKFSRSENGFEPSYKSNVIELPPLSGRTEIVVEICNYHYSKGGFWETIELGERKSIASKVQKTYQVTSFIAGSIFLWGLYHIGLFLMRRNDKASLYLALFCFFLVLRILTTGERLLNQIYPGMSMDVLIRLEFTTFYVATGVYAHFFRITFPKTMSHRSIVIALGSIVPFVLSLFLPVYLFTDKVIFFQIIVILISLRTLWAIVAAYPEDKIGAGLSLFGFLFVFFTLLNDILYYNNIVNTMGLTPFGFLGFTLFQGYILSYGYTRAYESTEKLNSELKTLKEGLEDLVFERTKELQASQENIQQLSEFAKTLNSSLEFESILQKAFDYLSKRIECDSVILFLANAQAKRIDYFQSILPPHFPMQSKQALKFLSFSMDEKGGFLSKVYFRKRPFRFSKVSESALVDSNERLVAITGNRPGILLPLLSQGEVVAILLLFSTKEKASFSRGDLSIIESVSESLATAVVNTLLLENVNQERNLAEIAKIEMENARNEVVQLNEFTKKINSESELEKIIQDMFEYVERNFFIDGTVVQLLDENAEELYTFKTTEPSIATPKQIQFFQSLRVPLQSSGGLIFKSYAKRRPIYFSRAVSFGQEPLDTEILNHLPYPSFLTVPLVVQKEVIAMVHFASFHEPLRLKKSEIARISGFCDQIAGAIQSSLLLRLAEEERKRAEKARQEIHQLNEFAKKVNSLINLENILAEIFQYIRDTYAIPNCVLYSLDEENQNFKYLNHSGFINLNDESIEFFKNLEFPLQEKGGFVYQSYLRKKHFYMKRIRSKIPFEIDRKIIEYSKQTSLLIAPLINNDKVVAMAMFGIEEPNRKLNDDQISGIIGVCEQIAGAINSNFLMKKIEEEKTKSDSLLLNILPANVASELQKKGKVNPVEFENVTMLMTGFPGFSGIASQLTPEELIEGLDLYFSRFDEIIRKRNLEKLKMTGDMYVAAGGLPLGNFTHTLDACLAALEIRSEVYKIKTEFPDIAFQPKGITIAIHSGPVVAGVIGKSKFNYDVWGKTVTQTQAIRRGGASVEINVSKETSEKINRLFQVENERSISNYEGDVLTILEVKRLKPSLSLDEAGIIPNVEFEKLYTQQKRGARILIK